MDKLVMELLKNKPTDQALFTLSDISPTREWNYELPTLTTKGRFTARQPWNTSEEFAEAFFAQFPLFSNIDMSNIAVMGGATFDLLHRRESKISDIDLFIVGDLPNGCNDSGEEISEEKKVLQRAEKFIDDVYAYLETYVNEQNASMEAAKASGVMHVVNAAAGYRVARGRGRGYGYGPIPVMAPKTGTEKMSLSTFLQDFKATRNGTVITFNIPTLPCAVQLVLSPHKTVRDLLRRVDLDCTAIAFLDGKSLYFNTISKFCYENACTIVGFQCSTRFENRIAKYFSEKGVDIILPLLDIKKIPARNLKYNVDEVLDLSRMAVIFSEVLPPGKIITKKIIPNTALLDSSEEGAASSTEESDASKYARRLVPPTGSASGYGCSKEAKNSGVIIHENLIHVIHGYTDKFQFYGEGKFVKDVLSPVPKLTTRMITNTYETVRGKLLTEFGAAGIPLLGEGKVGMGPNSGGGSSLKFDTLLLEKYFVVKPASQILMELLIEPLKRGEALRRAAMEAKKAKTATNSGGANEEKDDLGPVSALDTRFKDAATTYFDALIKEQIAHAISAVRAVEAAFQKDPSKFKIVSPITFDHFTADDWYGARYVKKE